MIAIDPSSGEISDPAQIGQTGNHLTMTRQRRIPRQVGRNGEQQMCGPGHLPGRIGQRMLAIKPHGAVHAIPAGSRHIPTFTQLPMGENLGAVTQTKNK